MGGYIEEAMHSAEVNAWLAEQPVSPDPALPHDVTIGPITFRKGVSLKTLISAAARWYKRASDAVPYEYPTEEDLERMRIAYDRCLVGYGILPTVNIGAQTEAFRAALSALRSERPVAGREGTE